jgi:hypothetical protein
MTDLTNEQIYGLPRFAAISTMPTRAAGFEIVVRAILDQVNMMFVYLDHFENVPTFLKDNPKIMVFRSEECGDYHASSRFLILEEVLPPSVVLIVDDDIYYPSNYVESLVSSLAAFGGNAVVGVHGKIFLPPHTSYVSDAHVIHFASGSEANTHCHELGAGTVAFISSKFNFRVSSWKSNEMDDISFAIEAQKLDIPRIAIQRPHNWLMAIEENQPDSLWRKTQKECSRQSTLMKMLLTLYQ